MGQVMRGSMFLFAVFYLHVPSNPTLAAASDVLPASFQVRPGLVLGLGQNSWIPVQAPNTGLSAISPESLWCET